MTSDELWTRRDIAEWRDVALSSVNGWIRRHRIAVAGHGEPERGGTPNLYRAADVKAADAAMPGKGNRTPRKATPEPESVPVAPVRVAGPPVASSVAQALRRFGILTRDDSNREGVRIRGGRDGSPVRISVDVAGRIDRVGLLDHIADALNMSGYVYTNVRDVDGFGRVTVLGRRDPDAPVPEGAPVVLVDVVEPGRALVQIQGRDVSGRIGRDGRRVYVEGTDPEYLIPIRVDSYRAAGEMFARLHGITGPVRVEIDHE